MSDTEKKRSFVLKFTDQGEVEITFKAGQGTFGQSREFYFSGSSGLIEGCNLPPDTKCTATTTTTSTTTTVTTTTLYPGQTFPTTTSTTTTSTTTTTICDCCSGLVLEFCNGEVTKDNLRKGELVFSNAGYIGTTAVDVIVTADEYDGDNDWNGIEGPYGKIAVEAGGEAKLKFKLVFAGTSIPATVPMMYFSVFGIDAGKDGQYLKETVSATGFSEYLVSPRTRLEMEEGGG